VSTGFSAFGARKREARCATLKKCPASPEILLTIRGDNPMGDRSAMCHRNLRVGGLRSVDYQETH